MSIFPELITTHSTDIDIMIKAFDAKLLEKQT